MLRNSDLVAICMISYNPNVFSDIRIKHFVVCNRNENMRIQTEFLFSLGRVERRKSIFASSIFSDSNKWKREIHSPYFIQSIRKDFLLIKIDDANIHFFLSTLPNWIERKLSYWLRKACSKKFEKDCLQLYYY